MIGGAKKINFEDFDRECLNVSMVVKNVIIVSQ